MISNASIGETNPSLFVSYRFAGFCQVASDWRRPKSKPVAVAPDANVVAIASDTGAAAEGTNPDRLPVFRLDDIAGICDFAIAICSLPRPGGKAKVGA